MYVENEIKSALQVWSFYSKLQIRQLRSFFFQTVRIIKNEKQEEEIEIKNNFCNETLLQFNVN